jgi:hypothetical protein
MNDTRVKSSFIALKSNIITKSKYDEDKYSCLPADLLPKEFLDERATLALTKQQRLQRDKLPFLAARFVDVPNEAHQDEDY